MAAIIRPSTTHPLTVPADAGLRLVPGTGRATASPWLQAHPSRSMLRRRRVATALVAVLLGTVLVAVAWFALQAWAPTPPAVPAAAGVLVA